jgi:hypothetical protein
MHFMDSISVILFTTSVIPTSALLTTLTFSLVLLKAINNFCLKRVVNELDLDNSKVSVVWAHALTLTTLFKQKLLIAFNKTSENVKVVKSALVGITDVVNRITLIESIKCICFRDTAELKIPLSENEKL